MMDEKDKEKIVVEFERHLPKIIRLIGDDLDKKGIRIFPCESENANVVVPSINEKP